jgi:GR25 family glycosyltransferase involved in LPS biosynthesis
MKPEDSMQIHVINLKRVPQRANFMAHEAARIGLEGVQFFPAVDAQERLSDDISPFYRPRSWKAYWELSATEVAVFESHRLLWEQCASENKGAFFICEDDILMSKPLPEALMVLSKQTDKFDFIHVDGVNVAYRLGRPENWSDVTVAPVLQPLSSAAAYVISPQGAQKLTAWAQKGFCDHVDDFLTRPHQDYRAFQLVPAAAVQGMFAPADHVPQEIRASERTSDPKINHKISKGPIAYRLAKEIRRGIQRTLRKSFFDSRLIKNGGSVGIIPLAKDLPGYRD